MFSSKNNIFGSRSLQVIVTSLAGLAFNGNATSGKEPAPTNIEDKNRSDSWNIRQIPDQAPTYLNLTGDFFTSAQVKDYLKNNYAFQDFDASPKFSALLKSIEKHFASLFKDNPIDGLTEKERFDAIVDSYILNLNKWDSKTTESVRLLIVDAAIESNSHGLLARKAFSVLAFGQSDLIVQTNAIKLLNELYSKYSCKEAGLLLLQVALYGTRDDMNVISAQKLSENCPEVAGMLSNLSREFRAVKEVAIDRGKDPLIDCASDQYPSLIEINDIQLPQILLAIQKARVAKRQKTVDSAWADAQAENKRILESFMTRSVITDDKKERVYIGYSDLQGQKRGTLSVNTVPEGAKITGIKVTHIGCIRGVQLIYELAGKENLTSWRGGDGVLLEPLVLPKDSKEHIFRFEDGEYMTGFRVQGAVKSITILAIQTNKQLYIVTHAMVADSKWTRRLKTDSLPHSGNPEVVQRCQPSPIGLVTFSDKEQIYAFGFVYQWDLDAGVRLIKREDIESQYPNIPELR